MICVISLLVLYMIFLVCLDPMLRRRSGSTPYQQHRDEEVTVHSQLYFSLTNLNGIAFQDDNIFANVANAAVNDSSTSAGAAGVAQLRPRASDNVLNRVGAEQDKWMARVKEQRKNIFTDHTMLN